MDSSVWAIWAAQGSKKIKVDLRFSVKLLEGKKERLIKKIRSEKQKQIMPKFKKSPEHSQLKEKLLRAVIWHLFLKIGTKVKTF